MLLTKAVKIRWSKKTKKHYVSLGYEFTKMGDEFEVKVEDLTKGCNVIISYNCDECGEIKECMYKDYVKIKKINGYNYCDKCGHNHRSNSKRKSCKKSTIKEKSTNKVSKNFKKSFYQWCIEHNRQDVLDRWDYELNDCSPNDIGYGSNKKCWFKCDKHTNHKSELKKLDAFTKGQEGSIKCNQCNSVAQYILDNFPNKKLEEVWDFDKNGDLDPWKVQRGSGKQKIWIKCQKVDYHGSYYTNAGVFTMGFGCPYCYNKKVHPRDSLGQYIIDNFGEDFLNKIWSDKNKEDKNVLFNYKPCSGQEFWWSCPDEKHEDFLRTCNSSYYLEFRCPVCSKIKKESMYEKKVRVYLETLNYDVFTEHECTIVPINPKSNRPLPFDNEIVLSNGKHLIIEVHGQQHYKVDSYYNETEEDLHYTKLKDRYKRIKCKQAGYEYLEIPYTAFDKKETYKQTINNKIKNILKEE